MGLAPGCAPGHQQGLPWKENASHYRGRDLVCGTRMPHGSRARSATNLGIPPFSPFYVLLFPGWFSLDVYVYRVRNRIVALD